MGTSSNNLCKTVAVRFYFDFNVNNGKSEVSFVPHEIIIHKVERPKENGEEPKRVVFVNDVKYLRSLEPLEWKKQDHYRVLGISNMRYDASDEVIRTAYRKMVLKHHPDKRKAKGEKIKSDEDYFMCITMAYETLGTTSRRRAYDSVDPEFDDSLPAGAELKQDFYEIFDYYFRLNSRWSEKTPVPELGGPDALREDVDRFYNFWYNFKSWREYSYEDEEDKEKCSDRDERRMCEKINKAERIRKKKEEMLRIRNLVDMAYKADPRIVQFKEDDKEKKLAAKRARQTAAQAKKEEEERLMKEAKLAREQIEAVERAKIEAKRQEREAQKRVLKKERKIFRDMCKSNDYYAQDKNEVLTNMQAVDKICEQLSAMQLEDLNKQMQNNGRTTFLNAVKECEELLEAARKEVLQSVAPTMITKVNNVENSVNQKAEWSQENIQLLIKAVNLFPAGTNKRWDVVANFVNQHGSFPEGATQFNSKDVLGKAKDLQKNDFSKSDLKEAANKEAFNNFVKDKRTQVQAMDNSEISTKIDGSNENNNKKSIKMNGVAKGNNLKNAGGEKLDSPWTSEEQQLLEQALKTYNNSTPDRWDRIAECIPNRTKKDCMRRYKELVEIIKAKKAAQVTVNNK